MTEAALQQWSPETWREQYAARRARLMNAQSVKKTERPQLKIIRPRTNDAVIYLIPIGPKWHTHLYETPIGPRLERQIGSASRGRKIIEEVSTQHQISVNDIVSSRRQGPIVRARQEAMWRMKEELDWSLPQIGRFLGGRDHTTVLHGIRRHQNFIERMQLCVDPLNQSLRTPFSACVPRGII